MIPSESDLIYTVIDQVHFGIEDQIDMFSTKDIALAERRRLIIGTGVDRMRQGLEVLRDFAVVDLGGSHRDGDGRNKWGKELLSSNRMSRCVEKFCTEWDFSNGVDGPKSCQLLGLRIM